LYTNQAQDGLAPSTPMLGVHETSEHTLLKEILEK